MMTAIIEMTKGMHTIPFTYVLGYRIVLLPDIDKNNGNITTLIQE
jgi:hypothetical protein